MTAAKNIELTFASDEMKDKFEKEFNKFTSDSALMEKIDAVDTIEEIYEVCKDRVQFSLDQYREIMKDIETQLKSNVMDNQDEELSDDDLEDVVGGSWSSFWKSVGKAAAIVGIVAGVVVAAAVTGGLAGAAVAGIGYGICTATGVAVGGSAIVMGATTGAAAGIGVAVKALVTD